MVVQEGNQKIGADGLAGLEYGVSVTDACVSFDATLPMLRELAEACPPCRAHAQMYAKADGKTPQAVRARRNQEAATSS